MPEHLGLPILFFLDFSLSARAGPLLLWGLLSVFVFSSGSPLSPWDPHKNRKTVRNLKQWVLWTDFEGTLLHHSPWMRVCAPTSGAQKCVVFAAPTLRSEVTAVTHITEKYMDLSRQSPVKRMALQEDSSSLLASLPTMSNRTKSGIMANKLPAVAQMCKL